MKFIPFVIVSLLALVSCSEKEATTIKAIDKLGLLEAESFTLNEKYRGHEHRDQLKEIVVASRPNDKKTNKAKTLLSAVNKIDKVCEHRMTYLNELKTTILNSVDCSDCITIKERDMYTSKIDVTKANSNWSKKHKIEDLSGELFDLASALSNITSESHPLLDETGNIKMDDRFSFELKRPTIDDIAIDIRKQLDNSQVHPDDKYVILDFVVQLLDNSSVNEELNTIDALQYYTYAQRKIMSARAMAIANIRSRISYCGPGL